MRSHDRLLKWIEGKSWVKGAVNYDEDLHFSSFYLRASHARAAASLYRGYTSIFAFYEGFTECYYLQKSECTNTARTIITRALRQPSWLPALLAKIQRKSDDLSSVFEARTTPARLSRMATSSLLALYADQARRQQSLNRLARLPEALDRGVSYFTKYLREHLAKLGLSESECEETFACLSQPVLPSVLAEELIEFSDIVRQACDHGVTPATGSLGRARMMLQPALLRRLEAHRAKWRFLPYHGYGRRELPSLGEYIERLNEHLACSAPDRQIASRQEGSKAMRARERLMQSLRLDRAHQALFDLYPQIGAVKLYRRHAQLRNFYYLDMLLAEIADRLNVSEWTVRCMLPEEVRAALKAGRVLDGSIPGRTAGCLFALLKSGERFVTGAPVAELRQLFEAKTRTAPEGNILHGTVACRGVAVGPCKIVIRADDVREDFPAGTILVSESTDPDLVGLLRHAGGVLTEQGGVTAHAALICRELGVPAIIGIDGLLERVRDGDVVEVDAVRGRVILGTSVSPPPTDLVFTEADSPGPDRIGSKAHNLGVVRALGFPVPDYVVLNYDGVRGLLNQPANGVCKQLVQWTQQQLNLPRAGKIALRSSALDEDRTNGSQAGAYHSLLDVERDELAGALEEFVRRNGDQDREAGYRGAIIVQRMIHPEFAGVCLTVDPRTGNGNHVIIELAAGGNQDITQGTCSPERIIVDRLSGDILDSNTAPGRQHPAVDVADLVRQFLSLEAHFGQPLDIEWAWLKRKLYILQARPIVH